MPHATKLRSSLLIMILAISTLTLTGCFDRANHHSFKHEMMFDLITWKLDLNEQQESKLLAVKTEILSLKDDIKTQKSTDQTKVLSLIESDYIPAEELMGLVDNKREIIELHIPRVITALTDFHQTLNPEQKQKIAEYLREEAFLQDSE